VLQGCGGAGINVDYAVETLQNMLACNLDDAQREET
jgi:hypothetical protein